jgi:hypothetical protein
MAAGNPIEELMFLAQAAAEAGRDWREEVGALLPALVVREATRLRQALFALQREAPERDADLAAAVLEAVQECMAEIGYI